MIFRLFICLLLIQICCGCATWYQRTAAFQQAVSQGEFEQAEKLLQKDKKQSRDKNKILYYLNQGMLMIPTKVIIKKILVLGPRNN